MHRVLSKAPVWQQLIQSNKFYCYNPHLMTNHLA